MTERASKRPLISVVIPTYNAELHIADCLESVASQRGVFETEIIVVDDGSSDKTRECVQAFGLARLIEQSNAGPSAARNRGISECSGDFVAFLDSDDLWTENKLSIQMEMFYAHPEAGLVFGDCRLFDEYGLRPKSMFIESGLDETFWGDQALVRDAYAKLFNTNYIPTGSAVVRRDCFETAGTFDESMRYVEDRDLWFRLALYIPFAYTTHVCELKRLHHSNVSNNADAMALGYIEVLKKQQRLYAEELRRRRIRVNPRIAYEYAIIGDRCERRGRMREARRWYIKGLLQNPSPRMGYYWLRSLLSRSATP